MFNTVQGLHITTEMRTTTSDDNFSEERLCVSKEDADSVVENLNWVTQTEGATLAVESSLTKVAITGAALNGSPSRLGYRVER